MKSSFPHFFVVLFSDSCSIWLSPLSKVPCKRLPNMLSVQVLFYFNIIVNGFDGIICFQMGYFRLCLFRYMLVECQWLFFLFVLVHGHLTIKGRWYIKADHQVFNFSNSFNCNSRLFLLFFVRCV